MVKCALLTALIALVICLSAFAEDQKAWTIFVEINGDSAVPFHDPDNGYKGEDMDKVVYQKVKENALQAKQVNTVILYHSGEVAHYGVVRDPVPTKVEWITDGKIQDSDELGKPDLTDPKTLSDFLKWGLERAKASNYVFYFWGHRIPSSMLDAQNDNGHPFDYSHPRSLYNIDLFRKGLVEGGFDGKQNKFKAILMSTCYGASLQSVSKIYDLTEYYLAVETRLLFGRGLSRDFIIDLNNNTPILDVLKSVYKKAIDLYLAPWKNKHARRLRVAKVNPSPVIFETQKMPPVLKAWKKLLDDFEDSLFHWAVGAEINRSYMVNSDGSGSGNWLDMRRLLYNWSEFLAHQYQEGEHVVAEQGLRTVDDLEEKLAAFIVLPRFKVRLDSIDRKWEDAFGASKNWEVSKAYSGLSIFLPRAASLDLRQALGILR